MGWMVAKHQSTR